MSGNDIASIVRSPAFTIFVATVCTIVIMKQAPVMMAKIREVKSA